MEIALTAVIGLTVAYAAFGRRRLRDNLAIIGQYRPRHLLTGALAGVVTAATALGLMAASPVFRKNPFLWAASELFHWGNGNGQANIIFSGLNWRWYAVVFLPVLILALPRLAAQEEIQYRDKTRNWLDGSLRSLRFGLAHLLMLIPFGTALALTWGGLLFTWAYFRGGVRESTLYHAAYNTVLVTALLIWLLVTW